MDHMMTWTTHLKVRFADVEMQIVKHLKMKHLCLICFPSQVTSGSNLV